MSKESQVRTCEAWQPRGLAGQLNWTSSQTSTEMSFSACEVSTLIKDAKTSDLVHANLNIGKLKLEQISLQFPNPGSIKGCMIVFIVMHHFRTQEMYHLKEDT